MWSRNLAFLYTEEGVNIHDINGSTVNYINQKQAEAFDLAQKYRGFKCEEQRA